MPRLTTPLLCVLLLGTPAPAQQKRKNAEPAVAAADVTVPDGRRLVEIAPVDASPVLVGGSINAAYFGTASEVILNREFGFVTPGNDFKQTAIHPEPGVWKWRKPDSWLKRFERNDQIVRLHAAVSPQCSGWAKDDARTDDELARNMEEYLAAVCDRYGENPRVRWIDVVNETVSRDGTWFGPRPGNTKWENPWTQIGADGSSELKVPRYIPRAFEIAAEHAPKLKLVYNQHGGMERPMWDRVKGAVEYLRGRGLRVDGVGWQGHVNTGFERDPENMARLNALIDWCHDRGLEFHITENTVWVRDGDTLEAQAATFRALLGTIIAHRGGGVVSWNAWQMRDSETQRDHLRGCLFDAAGTAKPAYHAVQAELEALAATSGSGTR